MVALTTKSNDRLSLATEFCFDIAPVPQTEGSSIHVDPYVVIAGESGEMVTF